MTFDLLLTPDPNFGLVFCHASCGVVTVSKTAAMFACCCWGEDSSNCCQLNLGGGLSSEYGIAYCIVGRNSFANIMKNICASMNV